MVDFPNFFILGAAKSGTTTLYRELKKHPEIYLPTIKEPMFFSSDDKYSKGLGWYSDNFFKSSGHKRICGEATPHYLYWAEKVAPRMNEHFTSEQIKFIVILRNPVDRAYSWYWNMIREGKETLDFEKAVKQEPARLLKHKKSLRKRGSMVYGYLKGGMYATQLKEYFNYFPRKNFFILIQRDLIIDYEQTFAKIFAFLNVSGVDKLLDKTQNSASLPRSRWLQQFLVSPSGMWHSLAKPFTHFLKPRAREYLKRTFKQYNLKAYKYPEIKVDTAKKLEILFRPENEKLKVLLDRDLSEWHLS